MEPEEEELTNSESEGKKQLLNPESEEEEQLINPEGPVGREWKDHWRAKEKDPSKKRETRTDKRAARRQLHKRDRKQAKENLRKLLGE